MNINNKNNKKNRLIAAILTFSLSMTILLGSAAPQWVFGTESVPEAAGTTPYAPNEVIVVFDEKVSQTEADSIAAEVDAEETELLKTMQGNTAGVVTIPEDTDVEAAAELLESQGEVSYAQPNYAYQLSDDASDKSEAVQKKTDDAAYNRLWHLKTVEVEKAWDILAQKKNSKVKVAVLDTGANMNHEDLQTNLNKDLSVDVTTSTYQKLKKDSDGHGTHVTGIIGATSNNEKGIAGVAAGKDNNIISLMTINIFKFFNKDELYLGSTEGNYALTTDIVKGISYAVKNGAKVVNMSLGFEEDKDTDNSYLESAVAGAVKSGATLVAAAGNDANTITNYPADFSNCISVISTNSSLQKSVTSNYGPAKDISAPGETIYSTLTTTKASYGSKSGTSMASPVVSGVAAMLYYIKPSLTVNQVKNILYQSAVDLYTPGWDEKSGYGNVNAHRAVQMLEGITFVSRIELNESKVTLKKGDTKTLTATISPSNASDTSVKWTSSNSKVASVSAGKVTAKASGIATISAVPKDGSNIAGTCKIMVPYKIAYDTKGGINHKSNPSSYYNETVRLQNPSKSGYQFKGWYTSSNYKTKVTEIKKGTKKNYKLYAKWAKVTVGKTSIRKIDKPASTTLKTYYNSVSGAKGYQVVYDTNKKFQSKQSALSPTTVKTLKNLKSKKRYYIRVRAYKIDSAGKNVYGPYSTIKSR